MAIRIKIHLFLCITIDFFRFHYLMIVHLPQYESDYMYFYDKF